MRSNRKPSKLDRKRVKKLSQWNANQISKNQILNWKRKIWEKKRQINFVKL